ncbi:SspB-related isopeptide-forming adhesin [Streptococcus ovis]|uniref:LPXTG cell wall anchor domain-containing protein n=1 Tax=Streptococcus ovis TaxID=82806 RepID=UPI000381EFA1|nr:SspB-related isopeptide-forming adhesin [Streptococcus ovis]
MLENKVVFGLRKAKNVTTLVGVPLGTMKKAIVLATAVSAVGLTFVGYTASAEESESIPAIVESKLPETIDHNQSDEGPFKVSSSINDGPVKLEEPSDVISSATNLADQPAESSDQAIDSQKRAGTSEGDITTVVPSPNLDASVQQAKAAGIDVVVGDTKPADNYASAQKSYDIQQAVIDDVTKTYDNATKAVSDANKQVDDIATKATNGGIDVKVTTQTVTKSSEVDTSGNVKSLTEVDTYLANKKIVLNDYAQKMKVYEEQLSKFNKDSEEYKKLFAEYQQLFVQYQKDKSIFDASLAEYTSKKAQFDKGMVEYNAKIAQYQKDKPIFDASLAEYTSKKAQFDKDMVEYNAKMIQYQKDKADFDKESDLHISKMAQYKQNMIDYNAAMIQYQKDKADYDKRVADLKSKVGKTGYPTKYLTQYLNISSEPNARIKSVEGNVATIRYSLIDSYQKSGGKLTDSAALLSYITANAANAFVKYGGPDYSNFLWLDKGDQFTVTYDNLQNSNYGDSVLGSLKYTYTVNSLSGGSTGVAQIYTDPTSTIFVYSSPVRKADNSADDLNITMNVRMFDKEGNEIIVSKDRPVAVNFGSLNNKTSAAVNYSNIEYVNYGAAELVELVGSSVKKHGNFAYAATNNSYVDGSSTSAKFYSAGDEKKETRYYGSAIGLFTSPISFQFGLTNRDVTSNVNGGRIEPSNIWFAFNTNVVGDVPVTPVEPPKPTKAPVPPTPPTQPTKPTEPIKPTPPTQPTKPTEPIKPTPPTQPTKPTEPTPPTKPETPEIPPLSVTLVKFDVKTPKVNVNHFTVTQKPTISKSVEDSGGTDLHNKTVAKASNVVYRLKTDVLKAGRKVVANGSYVIVDSLPQGYEIDLTKVETENPDFKVTYAKDNHTLTFVGKDSLVAAMNADLSKDYDVIDPIIRGLVLNDRATYLNNYTLQIGNDYKVYSNTVVVHTPPAPTPTKQVKDVSGVDIDGKLVNKGQVINYVRDWVLDQYKDIVANAVAIQKGFGKIDNYDETKVKFMSDKTTMIDSDGNTVTGLKAYVIQNIAEAPEEIKALVQNANVPIVENDEFVIWVAENPMNFYDKYVVTGKTITFTTPAEVLDSAVGPIDNVAYQIDFGNGYVSNVVTNHVPPTPPTQPTKPTEPIKPTPPTTPPSVPVTPARFLPQTGEHQSPLTIIGATVLAVMGLLGLRKKEEQ